MFVTQRLSYIWRQRLSGALKNLGAEHTRLICCALLLLTFAACCTSGDFDVASGPDTFVVFEESLYFEIVWPESLMYTFKVRHAKDFGTKLNKLYSNVELIRTDPEDACQTLQNDMTGSVALILRGGCSFLTKTKVAERAGALAAIIADNDESNDVTMVDMIDDSTERVVHIPSYFLLGKDGLMIRRQLSLYNSDRAIINIPINLTNKPLTVKRQPPWTVW